MAKEKISRREFLSYSALIGAVGAVGGIGGVLSSCSSSDSKAKYTPLVSDQEVYIPNLTDKAVDGKEIKAGIIGCGSRGSGAAHDFLNAGDGLSIVAMADIFPDRLEWLRGELKKNKNQIIEDDKIYYGFEAYKELIDKNPDLDVIIVTTPTVFHPIHAKYAIDAGKNVFCEKPAGVDPVGCRMMLAAAKQAKAQGLSLVTGTQRHHERSYVESYKRVREGMIGEIVSGNVYWNQGGPWFRRRDSKWTDMEYMLRDFFSWNWLCGDHLLDQGVHNVDVFTWFSHKKPVSVVGMGSRIQRTTGDIYDNFSVDLIYEGGIHLHAMARQIDDCANNIGEFIQGTKGSWSSHDMAIKDLEGNIIWQYDHAAAGEQFKQHNPYILEHVNLVNSIRTGTPVCTAETTVYSSLACIMGRESAYTGKQYTWEDMMTSELSLMPEKLDLGNTDMSKYVAPKPGKSNG